MTEAKIKMMTKAEAEVELAKMKGWPQARIEAQWDADYVIVGHAETCTCGMCPVMHDDGRMK